MRRFRLPIALVVAGAVFACSSDDATDPNAPMGLAIAVEPSSAQILVADTITLADNTALSIAASSLGHPVTAPRAEWTSSSPTVALVDSTGRVHAVGIGATTITARVNGEKATAVVTVAHRVAVVTLTPGSIQGLAGDSAVVTATAVDAQGAAVPGTAFLFTSTDPTAVSVTRTGNQTARLVLLKSGTTGVSVTAGGRSAGTSVSVQPRDFIGSLATSAPVGALVLAAGEDATCGIIGFGRGYCFGRGDLLGVAKDTSCFNDDTGGTVSCSLIPLRMGSSLSFASLSVGDSVACGITTGNNAYCWGLQTYGQLGNGVSKTGSSTDPSLVIGAVSRNAVSLIRVSAGANHACGLSPAGQALCWGKDSAFQLGTGDNRRVNSTTPIPIKSALAFTEISAGGDHTCALTASGSAVCWGDNSRGQIGNGSSADSIDTPVVIAGAFTQISSGGHHTCALSPAGAAFCWGANDSGQVGNNTGIDSPLPVAVTGGFTFKAISAGRYRTCGVTTAGAAVCWGSNNYGQAGDGTIGSLKLAPVAVSGGHTDFVAIATGVRHTCALAATGAFCWGSNMLGALGNELQAMVQLTPTKTATPQ